MRSCTLPYQRFKHSISARLAGGMLSGEEDMEYNYICRLCRRNSKQISLPTGWGPDQKRWRCRECQEATPLVWDDVLLHIDHYRTQVGETKQALSYAMGMNRVWWNAVLAGNTKKPSLDTMRAVLQRYEVPETRHAGILAAYDAVENPRRSFHCQTPGCASRVTARHLPKTWRRQDAGVLCKFCCTGELRPRTDSSRAKKPKSVEPKAGATDGGIVFYSGLRVGGDAAYKARPHHEHTRHLVRIQRW